jgi:DeoR/GlpR family transcriptional regulator of sugar metabolism
MTADRETRQKEILKTIRGQGGVRVAELCVSFEASEATIRRDLDELEASGMVKRTHGGAIAVKESPPERAVLQRAGQDVDEKQAIAREAASLIRDGDTIFLGSGSTTLFMVPFLQDLSITVITNSLPIINRLVDFEKCKTVVVGGILRVSELSIIGHISVRTLEDLRADKVFMGAEAIHLQHGLTNSYLEETMTDRAIVDISSQIILLADHTKFDRVCAAVWGPLSLIKLLITDWKTDRETIDRLREYGIEVMIASRPGEKA